MRKIQNARKRVLNFFQKSAIFLKKVLTKDCWRDIIYELSARQPLERLKGLEKRISSVFDFHLVDENKNKKL